MKVFFTATDCSHVREKTQYRIADLMGLQGTEDKSRSVTLRLLHLHRWRVSPEYKACPDISTGLWVE